VGNAQRLCLRLNLAESAGCTFLYGGHIKDGKKSAYKRVSASVNKETLAFELQLILA
jgi:hypothetical protein